MWQHPPTEREAPCQSAAEWFNDEHDHIGELHSNHDHDGASSCGVLPGFSDLRLRRPRLGPGGRT